MPAQLIACPVPDQSCVANETDPQVAPGVQSPMVTVVVNVVSFAGVRPIEGSGETNPGMITSPVHVPTRSATVNPLAGSAAGVDDPVSTEASAETVAVVGAGRGGS
ncbi:MAG: hypothetical protein ACLQBX_17635 [Candidatus Limnocylindrales bacterium]